MLRVVLFFYYYCIFQRKNIIQNIFSGMYNVYILSKYIYCALKYEKWHLKVAAAVWMSENLLLQILLIHSLHNLFSFSPLCLIKIHWMQSEKSYAYIWPILLAPNLRPRDLIDILFDISSMRIYRKNICLAHPGTVHKYYFQK